jgi:hypothetical protein
VDINSQMRRGMERLIALDADTGTVTRQSMIDNGRGQMIPGGEPSGHTLWCRVGYQAGGVWPARPWEGGLTIDTTPFVLAGYDEDIRQGDLLEWRGRRYTVGAVTRPECGGGPVCTQAPLTEVRG